MTIRKLLYIASRGVFKGGARGARAPPQPQAQY